MKGFYHCKKKIESLKSNHELIVTLREQIKNILEGGQSSELVQDFKQGLENILNTIILPMNKEELEKLNNTNKEYKLQIIALQGQNKTLTNKKNIMLQESQKKITEYDTLK